MKRKEPKSILKEDGLLKKNYALYFIWMIIKIVLEILQQGEKEESFAKLLIILKHESQTKLEATFKKCSQSINQSKGLSVTISKR